MDDFADAARYREVIDRLVRACREGQGQIGPRRVRVGVWNENATDDFLPDQKQVNAVLSDLAQDDREVVAHLLEDAFTSGVHEALVVLHECGVEPFDNGYEGSPFHDFVGRLNGWNWPA